MEYNKFILSKKWYNFTYQATDALGQFYCRFQRKGVLKPTLFMIGTDEVFMLQAVREGISGLKSVIVDDGGHTGTFRIKWTMKSFELYLEDGTTILIESPGWGKKFIFTDQGKPIAVASSKSLSYNHIGLAVSEEYDANIFLLVTVIICRIKVSGSASAS